VGTDECGFILLELLVGRCLTAIHLGEGEARQRWHVVGGFVIAVLRVDVTEERSEVGHSGFLSVNDCGMNSTRPSE